MAASALVIERRILPKLMVSESGGASITGSDSWVTYLLPGILIVAYGFALAAYRRKIS
ncbi:MAG: hypothetical protein IPL43_12335 [Micropruina sp.]|nr:hypothetical protein [Micropruina sp.]